MRDQWYRSDNEIQRLTQGGVSGDVIDAAVTSFILQTIVQHGAAAERLCNKVQCLSCVWVVSFKTVCLNLKDPLALKQGDYLARIFPKSKWIFMVRDGRAVVHSVIKR